MVREGKEKSSLWRESTCCELLVSLRQLGYEKRDKEMRKVVSALLSCKAIAWMLLVFHHHLEETSIM